MVVDTDADYDLSYHAVTSLLKIASRCPDGAPRGEACADDILAGRVSAFLIEQAEDDPVISYIVSNSLFDDDVDMRIYTAQLMASIATESDRGMLEGALNDDDERVRETAGRALAELDARTSPEMEDVPPANEPNTQEDGVTVPAEPSVKYEQSDPRHVFPTDVVYPLLEEELLPPGSSGVE
jgi:hypothetical protein